MSSEDTSLVEFNNLEHQVSLMNHLFTIILNSRNHDYDIEQTSDTSSNISERIPLLQANNLGEESIYEDTTESESSQRDDIKYCVHHLASGRACRKYASKTSDYCWIHNPEKKRSRQRKCKGVRLRKCKRTRTTITQTEECPVCYYDTTDCLPCGHYIHRNCVIRSGHAKCPLCRSPIHIRVSERERFEKFTHERSDYIQEVNNHMAGLDEQFRLFEHSMMTIVDE